MPTAQDLIEALNAEHGREQTLVDSLSESEQSRVGTYDHWSAKDLLAHISAWKHQVVLYLQEDPMAVSEATDEDVESANVAFFKAHNDQTWDSILSDMESVHQNLVDELQRLSESELADRERFPWQEGLPLWRRLAGWIFTHPWMHLAEHALEKGDREGAVGEARHMVEAGRLLSDDRHWTGAVKYNTACIFARAGALDMALQHLESALKQRPDLIEASKQDDDLALLRADDRLVQMYAALEP
jgi:hypothetical protein